MDNFRQIVEDTLNEGKLTDILTKERHLGKINDKLNNLASKELINDTGYKLANKHYHHINEVTQDDIHNAKFMLKSPHGQVSSTFAAIHILGEHHADVISALHNNKHKAASVAEFLSKHAKSPQTLNHVIDYNNRVNSLNISHALITANIKNNPFHTQENLDKIENENTYHPRK